MKGTEVTEAQMHSARMFIQERREIGLEMPPDERFVQMRFGDFARIVAWYGALRYQAGKNGTGGTFDHPGVMVTRKQTK